MLSANDPDDALSSLTFLVASVQHGHFAFNNNPSALIVKFSQQNITDATVQFILDGSANAPAFDVAVTDGKMSSPFVAAVIHFSLSLIVSSTGVSGIDSSSATMGASIDLSSTVQKSSTGLFSSSAFASSSSAGNSDMGSTGLNAASSSSGGDAKDVSSSTALVLPLISSSGAQNADGNPVRQSSSSSTADEKIDGVNNASSSGETAKIGIIAGASVGIAGLCTVLGVFACREKNKRLELKLKLEQERSKQLRDYERIRATQTARPGASQHHGIELSAIAISLPHGSSHIPALG